VYAVCESREQVSGQPGLQTTGSAGAAEIKIGACRKGEFPQAIDLEGGRLYQVKLQYISTGVSR
jgi:hypothetical protein